MIFAERTFTCIRYVWKNLQTTVIGECLCSAFYIIISLSESQIISASHQSRAIASSIYTQVQCRDPKLCMNRTCVSCARSRIDVQKDILTNYTNEEKKKIHSWSRIHNSEIYFLAVDQKSLDYAILCFPKIDKLIVFLSFIFTFSNWKFWFCSLRFFSFFFCCSNYGCCYFDNFWEKRIPG